MTPAQISLLPRVVERIRALGDETRVRLLLRLREGPANVSTLVDAVGAQQASVSKHLAVLRSAGLVDCRREGTQAVYSVLDQSVFELCGILCAGVVQQLEREQSLLIESQGDSHVRRRLSRKRHPARTARR